MIRAHGPTEAPFMLIADGATPEDIASEYALSGSQEILLNHILPAGVSVKEAWRTCLVKDRVVFGKKYYEEDEFKNKVKEHSSILLEEIDYIKPKLLVPLGEGSFRFLTNLYDIRKFRGSVLQTKNLSNPIKVLPILGPQPFLNSEYKLRHISQIDASKIPRFLNDDPPPEQNLKIWICTTANALRNFLDRQFSLDKILVFDIETFLGIPTCISFCFDGQESVCIPFLDSRISIDERALMMHLVARVLASPIRKVNQNIKYDIRCLERFNFTVENVAGDTMLNASVLMPEFEKNLGFLNSLYTDIPYFKDEGKVYDPSAAVSRRDQTFLYNAKDSLSTHRIYDTQVKEIEEIGSTYVAENLSALILIYKKMEDNGLYYDDEKRKILLAKYEALYNIHVYKLQLLCNETLNPGSPKQVDRMIYETLGYKKNRYAKDTGEESLEHLLVYGTATRSPVFGKLILQGIIDCRKIHKVIEYLNTFAYPDGHLRCEYNLAGTKTGRTTAGQTTDQILVWEHKKTQSKLIPERLGRSFQTIGKHGFRVNNEDLGKELRSIFVPHHGYTFVENDLSQAEARVDAVLAGNFDIISIFDGPIGIHKLTGSWVFDCDPLDIKKNTLVTDPITGITVDRYLMSKTIRHAGERNMKADRLVSMTQLPYQFCNFVLDKFHAKQPEIRDVYHRDVKACIDATGALRSPNGRVRQFFDRRPYSQHTYNEAISQLPQAIVSDQLKFSLVPTFKECDTYALLVNEQHDGALAEVKDDKVVDYVKEFRKNVETGIDFNHCSLQRDYVLTIPMEASISKTNWMEMKDFHE